MTTETPTTAGRLKRLTRAAMAADSALVKVDGLAADAGILVDDLYALIDRIEPSMRQLDGTLGRVDTEFGRLGGTRHEVDRALARVHRILDLIEWLLTPAYFARTQSQRLCRLLGELEESVRDIVRPQRNPEPEPVTLAQVHRIAG